MMTQEDREKLISKTLCYLLRHGHGLTLYRDGYAAVDDLIQARSLCRFPRSEVATTIKNSTSTRFGGKRFDEKFVHGRAYVRATYGHSVNIKTLENVDFPTASELLLMKNSTPTSLNAKSPNQNQNAASKSADESTLLNPSEAKMSLVNQCVRLIARNILLYENFAGIGDSHSIEQILKELKRTDKLNNKSLLPALVEDLETLELDSSVVITEGTLKRIGLGCPRLSILRLRDCLALTDHQLAMLAKKLTELRSLELHGCKYISDVGLATIGKQWIRSGDLKCLVLTDTPTITAEGLISAVFGENVPKTTSGKEEVDNVSKHTNNGKMLDSLLILQCEKFDPTPSQLELFRTNIKDFVWRPYVSPDAEKQNHFNRHDKNKEKKDKP